MSVPKLTKLMMVEDDEDIQKIAEIALQTVGGFEFTIFNSGKQALNQIEHINPDLVILDVMLPEIDGPTLLKKIRDNQATKSIPIVFMTAKVQQHECLEYYQMGAIDVIAKPFDPMMLADQIQRSWEKHHA